MHNKEDRCRLATALPFRSSILYPWRTRWGTTDPGAKSFPLPFCRAPSGRLQPVLRRVPCRESLARVCRGQRGGGWGAGGTSSQASLGRIIATNLRSEMHECLSAPVFTFSKSTEATSPPFNLAVVLFCVRKSTPSSTLISKPSQSI